MDEAAEAQMNAVMETIKAVRNMRAEMNVPLGRKGEVILQPATAELAAVLAELPDAAYDRQARLLAWPAASPQCHHHLPRQHWPAKR